MNAIYVLVVNVVVGAITLLSTSCRAGANYSVIHALFEEKLGSANYNPEVRPVNDHTTVTNLTFSYTLNTFVDIDDVGQTITTAWLFQFSWNDEMISWNFSDYKGMYHLQPHPKQIWRPRIIISNSPKEQDPFQDYAAPIYVLYNGLVSWGPSVIVQTSCQFKMAKYPFDVQHCFIELCPMSHFSDSLRMFLPPDTTSNRLLVSNEAWDLLSIDTILTEYGVVEKGAIEVSCARIQMDIQRRPTYTLVTVILPIVLLSFLNIFVFAIPVDSGEKISYGITVLLALLLFLSLISTILPKSSNPMPAVTIYLFCLLIGSLLSVLVSICIVLLHHKDLKEEKQLKIKANFQHLGNRFTNIRQAIKLFNGKDAENSPSTPDKDKPTTNQTRSENTKNRYRALSKHIDTISFIVYFFLWSVATLWFFIYVTS